MDLEQHLKRQIAFSRATFGPGTRQKGVIDHIRRELIEVENSDGSPEEWVDVVILSLDGLTRALLNKGRTVDRAAEAAVDLIVEKQNRNELRDWPDWRTAPADKAIEHVKVASVEEDEYPVWIKFRAWMTGYVPSHLQPSSEIIRAGIKAMQDMFASTPPRVVEDQIFRRIARDQFALEKFRRFGNGPFDRTVIVKDVADYLDLPVDRVEGYLK